MITKADLYPGQDEVADQTYQQLTMLVDQQKAIKSLLCRVSVVGHATPGEGSGLPDAADRHPDNMLKAWIWVVAQALDRSVEDIRKNLPLVNLSRAGSQTIELGFTTIPELRQVGDFSGSPGRVVCASSDDLRSKSFTFLSEDGELLETTFAIGEQPQFRSGSDSGMGPIRNALSLHWRHLSPWFPVRLQLRMVWNKGWRFR